LWEEKRKLELQEDLEADTERKTGSKSRILKKFRDRDTDALNVVFHM
jgi:hypothetical protein